MYDHLPLPWNIPHPIPSSILPESQFLKLDFDRDGVFSDPASDDFFDGGREVTLKQVEKELGTASMITRWREAHPEEAGTEKVSLNFCLMHLTLVLSLNVFILILSLPKDVLKQHIEDIRKVMGEQESVTTGSSTTIIFVKKALQA